VHEHEQWLDRVCDLAQQAGRLVMDVYATEFTVRGKGDASPVTEADERAEALIVAGLAALTPDLPIVAEEGVAAGRVPALHDRFWLVDPLDGTREFVHRNGEFTVNIALVHAGRPVLGVVHAPALLRLFGGVVGAGAFVEDENGRHPIRCRALPPEGATVLAAGEGDLYPRFGRTMEWDIAAGHAVLAAAGGSVVDLEGRPLVYGKPGFENPDFVAQGG
jgi:3'(2'), 5'-bisphosphate nucleotidase